MLGKVIVLVEVGILFRVLYLCSIEVLIDITIFGLLGCFECYPFIMALCGGSGSEGIPDSRILVNMFLGVTPPFISAGAKGL